MSLTLTKQDEDSTFGTSQLKQPSFAVLSVMVVHDEPLLVEYSILTFPTVPLVVQVMFFAVLARQISPP